MFTVKKNIKSVGILFSRKPTDLLFFSLLTSLFLSSLLFSQPLSSTNISPKRQAISGWGEISFGMSVEQVKKVFSQNYKWIAIKALNDDIVDEKSDRVLEIVPNRFFRIFQMQFSEDKLYLLRIEFSPKYFSYNILYEGLKQNYGTPSSVTFKRISWGDSGSELQLERELTLKYISKNSTSAFSNALPPPPVERRENEAMKAILEKL